MCRAGVVERIGVVRDEINGKLREIVGEGEGEEEEVE